MYDRNSDPKDVVKFTVTVHDKVFDQSAILEGATVLVEDEFRHTDNEPCGSIKSYHNEPPVD